MLQFDASIRRGKPPVDGPSLGIAPLLPSGHFLGQGCLVRDTPVQALAGQDAQLNLSHIQPTAMLRGVVYLQPLAFADICSPGTMANLKLNPAIEINLVDPMVRKGYRFKGAAKIYPEGPVLADFIQRYTGGGPAARTGVGSRIKAAVLVRVDWAEPLVSPGYIGGITEGQMRDQWEAHYAGLKPTGQS